MPSPVLPAERIALMVSGGMDCCAASVTGRISNALPNIVNTTCAFRLRKPIVDIMYNASGEGDQNNAMALFGIACITPQ